jgi:cell division protein FtsB
MTLLGKILTVLIIVMSVVFMSFSIMVFATHRNWHDHATDLRAQVENLELRRGALEHQIESLHNDIAVERAARRAALGSLQTKKDALEDELAEREQQLANVQAQVTIAAENVRTAENNLARLTDEVQQLRDNLRETLLDRDRQFAQVVELQDRVNEVQGVRQQLEERRSELLAEVSDLQWRLQRDRGRDYLPEDRFEPPLREIALAQSTDAVQDLALPSRSVGGRDGRETEVAGTADNQHLGARPDRCVEDPTFEGRVGQLLPAIAGRVVGASVALVLLRAVSAPDDHLATGPDRRMIPTRPPTVQPAPPVGRRVIGRRVPELRAGESAEDDHLAAGPDRRVAKATFER